MDPRSWFRLRPGSRTRCWRFLTGASDGQGLEQVDALARRHRGLLGDLGLPTDLVDRELEDLRDVTRGINLLREVTPRTCDMVLSYGERFMAPIFAAYLTKQGIPAWSSTGGKLGLLTDDRFTRARPLPHCYELIAETLAAAQDGVLVMTGYLGRTEEGQTTTLGRGGSDFSAAILARAVGAADLEIWTDVDGILTADPRIVSQARLIESLSFDEAAELAFSGAKVLHPSTITPAMDGDIPVRVRNTHAPERPGTVILGDVDPADAHLRSIAHKTGVQVVTIVSPRMLARHGFISRISGVFDRHGVSIDMVSTSEVSISLTTDESPQALKPALKEIREFASVEMESGRAQVSVVGAGVGSDVALLGEIFQTAHHAGASVEMISYGATRTNLSFLLREEEVAAVVAALHARYFEGE